MNITTYPFVLCKIIFIVFKKLISKYYIIILPYLYCIYNNNEFTSYLFIMNIFLLILIISYCLSILSNLDVWAAIIKTYCTNNYFKRYFCRL